MQAQSFTNLINDFQVKAQSNLFATSAPTRFGNDGLFATLFTNTLKSNDGSFNPISYNEKNYFDQNQNFLNEFKNDLASTGVPLDKLSLSSNSANDIQQMMVGQGYSTQDVNSFVNDLFQGGTKQNVKVSEFYQKANEKINTWDKDSGAYIETSMVPKLENALRDLGLNADQIKTAVEQSKSDTGKLDIKTLVNNLKNVTPVEQKSLSGDALKNVKDFLSQIGLSFEGDNIDLKSFVRVLNDKSLFAGNVKFSLEKMNTHLQNLVSSVLDETNKQNNTNLKKLFDSKLIVPGAYNIDTKDLAALEKTLRNMGLADADIQKILLKAKQGESKDTIATLIDSLKNSNINKFDNNNIIESAKKQDVVSLLKNWIVDTEAKIDNLNQISKLKSTLKQLGLSDVKIDEIINISKDKTGKISPKLLADALNDNKLLDTSKILSQSESLEKSKIIDVFNKIKNNETVDLKAFAGLLENLTNTKNLAELKQELTKAGLNTKQITSILEKAQVSVDSLSIQQILAGLKDLIAANTKSKQNNQNIDLKKVETLLTNIKDTNLAKVDGKLSEADLASLKDILAGFGLNKEDINTIIKSGKDIKDIDSFVKNLQNVLVKLPENSLKTADAGTLKNIEAFISRFDKGLDNQVSTKNALDKLLAGLNEKVKSNVTIKDTEQIIPAKKLSDLENILKELGLKSIEIKNIISDKNESGDINAKSLLNNLKQLADNSALKEIKPDTNIFDRLEKLMSLMKEGGENKTLAKNTAVNNFIQKLENSGLKPPVLPVSGIAQFEKTLSTLGLNDDQIKQVINQAKSKNGDIMLADLAKGIKDALNSLTQKEVVTDKASQNMQSFLGFLGIKNEEDASLIAKNTNRKLKNKNFISKKGDKGLNEKAAKTAVNEKNVVKNAKSNTQSLKANTSQTESNKEFLTFLKQDSTVQNKQSFETTAKAPAQRYVPTYMNDQISRQISMGLKNGNKQMTLQLKPPQLGSLQLDMEIQNDVLKISMATEKQATREMLLSHINELKDSLAQQGIKVDKVDIEINYNFNESLAQKDKAFDKNSFDKKNNNLDGRSDEIKKQENTEEDAESAPINTWGQGATLNLIA